ncbi:MAG: hypothetical protein H0Z40_01350 [Desulfotomaculum sp.]|nr:hypothetical protein [Desulfotomaculum sp.]
MQQANAKAYVRQGNVYHLQFRQHRPVTANRRLVWRPINAVQRWLEGEDKLAAKAVACGVLAVAAVYLVAQLFRR